MPSTKEIVPIIAQCQTDLSTGSGRTRLGSSLRTEWMFISLVALFCLIYAVWYPATFATLDESCILSLAYSISHGSLFILNPRPYSGLLISNHVVSLYSPFHAALLAPTVATSWQLSFLVTAAFYIAGAFILRKMLSRYALGSEWSVLYFLLSGALFYSQTLVASVPAAVLGLLAVSLCLREPARPFGAGLAFGLSVLIHPWMAPMAIVFSLVWCLEHEGFRASRTAISLFSGALPAIIILGLYNYFATGSPVRSAYSILGVQHAFLGEHFLSFLGFYIISLAIFPIAGMAVFSRRWSGTLALPAVSLVMVLLASLYYYRDGLNVGSARVATIGALIAGIIPGQRFLLPVSMIACLPAARFLSTRAIASTPRRLRITMSVGLGLFMVMFAGLSAAHDSYLSAHFRIQQVLYATLPAGANVIISGTYATATGELAKEFPPSKKVYRQIRAVESTSIDAYLPAPDAYVVIVTFPGGSPPGNWVGGRVTKLVKIRSWVWNRDYWIGLPVGKHT